jgi:FixJ family two-component response regulator
MLRAIDRLLLSAGLEAQLFSDPLGFLTYAKCHSVAVAVIDIWMPGISGLQVKKELQTISPKTRVIIITANEDDSVRNQAMQGGAIALFIKPFNDDEFLAAVHQAIAAAT